jgi:hypothetical protein
MHNHLRLTGCLFLCLFLFVVEQHCAQVVCHHARFVSLWSLGLGASRVAVDFFFLSRCRMSSPQTAPAFRNARAVGKEANAIAAGAPLPVRRSVTDSYISIRHRTSIVRLMLYRLISFRPQEWRAAMRLFACAATRSCSARVRIAARFVALK